jgi:hypothetical protein
MYKDKEVNKKCQKYLFINVWRKTVFDIYFTEFGTALTTILPILFQYCYKYCYSDSRYIPYRFISVATVHKGKNKITELQTILQRESQNS